MRPFSPGHEGDMTDRPTADELLYPFPEPPAPGEMMEVAPGILWTRIALPFQLNHVNIFVLDDGDGWAILDTGIDNKATRAAWEALAAGPLAGRRMTRLIVTHFHPDHIGLAGWLCERFDMPMLTTQTSFLGCLNISLRPDAMDAKVHRDFYLEHGLDAATTDRVATNGHGYLRMVSPLPPTFTRVVGGDEIRIGGRTWHVMIGDGHAPEQAMFWCREEKILLAADQVLAKISPNVSVWAVDPDGDPLGLYIRSLNAFKNLPEDALVLPGHQLPFYGLHERSAALVAHHEGRCAAIAETCAKKPCNASEFVPVLFHRALDPHQMSFAFTEVLAHVNYMLRTNQLKWAPPENGVRQVIAA
jgi:glyoxylase-like metal-dependent hydrolase (beta-lactamase superfamily II)